MGYNKFVQVGRVARINYGPQEGKLATIVDIVSDKRVLVDGENISRQVIPVARLQLTRQVVKVGRGARTGALRKIISKEQVAQKFAQSTLGKHYASQQRRENLTDFERFKVLVLRRRLSKLLRSKKGGK
jgi:large subunit ribosomal protein L14e